MQPTRKKSLEEIFGDPAQPVSAQPQTQENSRSLEEIFDANQEAPSRFGKGLVRSAAQGATFGFGDEIEALRFLWPGGETREEALKRIRGEMREYREAYPGTALAAELGGGLAFGGVGAARVGATKAATTLAGRAAQAVGRKAMTAGGQAAIGGFGAAEGDLGDRLKGAALGGAVGAGLPAAGKALLTKAPFLKQVTGAVTEPVARGYAAGQRTLADALESAGYSRAARAIEPQDLTRAQRVIGEEVPGSLTGPTVRSMAPETGSAREAARLARQEVLGAKQQRLSATQQLESAKATQEAALTAKETAAEAARVRLEALKAAQNKNLSAAQNLAAQREATAAKRVGALRATKAQTVAQSRQLKKQLESELADANTAATAEAKQAALDALEAAKANAERQFAGVVGDAQGKTRVMQESIRAEQRQIGDQMYGEIAAIGQPSTIDGGIAKLIADDPKLASAAAAVEAELEREGRTLTRITLGSGEDARSVVSPDVEFLDRMRRRLLNPKLGENVVGLKLSERTVIRNVIDSLEDRLANSYGDRAQEVRDLVLSTRAKYRGQFELLEAAQLGLDLPRVIAGRPSGLLRQGQKELDVVENVLREKQAQAALLGASDDEAEQKLAAAAKNWLDTYQTAAREALSRMRDESPDALKLLQQKFSTPAGKRRLALATGPEGVAQLGGFAAESVQQAQRQAAEAARGRMAPRIEAVQQRLATEPAVLAQRAERISGVIPRAEQLASEAKARVAQTRAAGQETMRTAIEAERTALSPLRTALASAKGTTRQARSQQRLAAADVGTKQQQAQVAVEALRQAKASGRDLQTAMGSVFSNQERAADVAQIIPTLSPAQVSQAREVMGSMFQRRINQLAAEGRSFEEIQRRLLVAERNPAVRALMGEEFASALRGLRPSLGTQLPGILGTAPRALIGRRVGGAVQSQENQP